MAAQQNTWARVMACGAALGMGVGVWGQQGAGQDGQRQTVAQSSEGQRPQTGGATRRSVRPRERGTAETPATRAQPRRDVKPEAKPESKPAARPVQESVLAPVATGEQAHERAGEQHPAARFMARGAGLRGVQFGPALEYAWWAKVQDVTLASYSGSSDGLRVVSLPVGEATGKVPVGSRVAWQAVGAQDGDAAIVSDKDIDAFEKLLPAAHDRAGLHRMVLADDSAKWRMVFTLASPLEDNRAGVDWMPEVCVAFAVGRASAGAVTIAAVDAKGNEIGTPVAVRVQDAIATTPALALSVLDAHGKVQETGEVRVASVDLSALGVVRVQQLLVRPSRDGDRTAAGEAVSGGVPREGFKVMLVETAGMPLPAWAVGD